MNADWSDNVSLFLILHGHLDLGIRSEPIENLLMFALFESDDEIGAEVMGHRHVGLCLVSRIPNHQTLITRA